MLFTKKFAFHLFELIFRISQIQKVSPRATKVACKVAGINNLSEASSLCRFQMYWIHQRCVKFEISSIITVRKRVTVHLQRRIQLINLRLFLFLRSRFLVQISINSVSYNVPSRFFSFNVRIVWHANEQSVMCLRQRHVSNMYP